MDFSYFYKQTKFEFLLFAIALPMISCGDDSGNDAIDETTTVEESSFSTVTSSSSSEDNPSEDFPEYPGYYSSSATKDKFDYTGEDNSKYDAASNMLVDYRNGKTYRTVNIGKYTWMAENLSINFDDESTSISCYDDDPANCETYGRLYTFSKALDLNETFTKSKDVNRDMVRGACPMGWHIPSINEFGNLMTTTGSEDNLKSKSGWAMCHPALGTCIETNGTDNYGFSALPGGVFILLGLYKYTGINTMTSFWSSTAAMLTNSYRTLDIGAGNATPYGDGNYIKASVRCVLDHEIEPEALTCSDKYIYVDNDIPTIVIEDQQWTARDLGFSTWAAAGCPTGFHLPSVSEWQKLLYSNNTDAFKSTSGWKKKNGTNSTCLGIRPSGAYNYTIKNGVVVYTELYAQGDIAVFWTSTKAESKAREEAYYYAFRDGESPSLKTAETVQKLNHLCVKDYEAPKSSSLEPEKITPTSGTIVDENIRP